MEQQEIEERGLSTTFVNPNGVLCKTLVLLGKPKYTMLNVEPDCYLNVKSLTKPEFNELSPDYFGLTSNVTNKL